LLGHHPAAKLLAQFPLFLFALCTSISAHFYARYRSKKELTLITDSMSSFMRSNSDDLTLPKEYYEIESQLIKIKASSQKQQQLVQMEMHRKNDLALLTFQRPRREKMSLLRSPIRGIRFLPKSWTIFSRYFTDWTPPAPQTPTELVWVWQLPKKLSRHMVERSQRKATQNTPNSL